MAKAPKPDPKENPDFKRVVKHFLSTPAKPHVPAKGKKIAKAEPKGGGKMIRHFLLAATLAATSIGNALASETPGKAYYLHIVTANGVSSCGPFEFFTLSRRQVPLPGQLVGGKFLTSACEDAQDVPVAGTITKTEVVLYEVLASAPNVFWMYTFQWPLQDGGWWTQYGCENESGCTPANSGTYALGLGEVPRQGTSHP